MAKSRTRITRGAHNPYTDEEKRHILATWKNSGLTIEAFARGPDLPHRSTLYGWLSGRAIRKDFSEQKTRTVYEPGFKEEKLRAWEHFKGSRLEFARQHKVPESTFNSWVNKHREIPKKFSSELKQVSITNSGLPFSFSFGEWKIEGPAGLKPAFIKDVLFFLSKLVSLIAEEA